MNALASHLRRALPDGMSYPDAAQLCLRLYCTVDGVPEPLLPLDKNCLGDAFADLSRTGWVHREESWRSSLFGIYLHEMTDRGHWVEMMASILKKGAGVWDMNRGEELACAAGLSKRTGEPAAGGNAE